MNAWVYEKTVDLSRDALLPSRLTVAYRDDHANSIVINVCDNGSPVDLSNYSALLAILRSDDKTAVTYGSIIGSTVKITLPIAAYDIVGSNQCSVILSDDMTGQRVTIALLTLDVIKTSSDAFTVGERLLEVGGEILETRSRTLSGAINEILNDIDKAEFKFFSSDVYQFSTSSYKDVTFTLDDSKIPLCAFVSVCPALNGAPITSNAKVTAFVSKLSQGVCKVTVGNFGDMNITGRVACVVIFK